MKKKILSLLMALAMIVTILPFEAFAVMFPMDEGNTTGSEDTGETPSDEESTPSEDDESSDGPLLRTDIYNEMHPTHLSTGEVALSGTVVSNPGQVFYAKNSVSTEGSVDVSDWSVNSDGVLSFTCSSGKEGDVITFLVDISSSKYAQQTLKVNVKLGYKQLMITSETTVVYGGTLTLTCAGMKGNGAVIYTVSEDTQEGSGRATISGNVLTGTAAGTVKVSATQVKDGELSAAPSTSVVITITKATPTGTPTFTKLTHAGHTLADTNLTLGNFSTEGTVEWVLPDDTVVVANTAYEWEFTPNDQQNYSSLKGTATPYTVSDSLFAIGEGVTEENLDGSFTTISFGEDSSSYKLTEYPDGSMTLIHTKMDGTVTTTEKKSDGTRTETIVKKDGSRQITATDKSGITHTTLADKYGYTSVQVYIPANITAAAVKSGTLIELPISELPCTDDRSDAPLITLTLRTTSPIRVRIPVNSPSAGTVAITVAKNGQETVVKTSTTGYDSVEVTLSGSATVKVADLSKRFNDVDRRNWYKDAADFATSRGLFNGITPFTFDANGHMSRAMLVTVLHNLEGNPRYGFDSYYGYLPDAKGAWYEAAAAWAIANGHISGFDDGTFRGDQDITREQLAVILYRYAGSPSSYHYVNASLTDYLDYGSISPYAYNAMYWAVCSGVLYTANGEKLSPQQPVTRAEVAQTFKNLVEFLVK